MAAIISDVRTVIGDTTAPYIFADADIQDELDAATEYLDEDDISTDTNIGKRAHKLQAAIFLVSDHLGKIKNQAVRSISEGDARHDYVDLQAQVETWKQELEQIIMKLQDTLFEVSFDP